MSAGNRLNHIKKILGVLLMAGLLFMLSACGGLSPTETTETFLQAVQAGDQETISTVYAGGTFEILPESIRQQDPGQVLPEGTAAMMQGFEFQVLQEEKDGKQATVDVEIKTYPFGEALKETLTECIAKGLLMALFGTSDDEIEELIVGTASERFSAMDEKSYTETVTIQLEKLDGTWKVSEMEEDSLVRNALTGNLIGTMKEFRSGLEESDQPEEEQQNEAEPQNE